MLYFKINNRRYTGSKFKLLDWIKNTIEDETQKNDTFCDLFAGTGCVAEKFKNNKSLIINDFLFSNNIIYKAFFDSKNFNKKKIIEISTKYLEIKLKAKFPVIILIKILEENFLVLMMQNL